jgi:hypothetical protein
MRQFLLGLSISIAFIVGCVTAQHVPGVAMPSASASTTAYTGQRWEYSCEKMELAATTKGYFEKLTSLLNDQGAAGWEVLPFDYAGYFCFKRPK